MNGLLLVDKPRGMTSHDVVARVRRLTQEKSVGHLGTLDPMATGLLPLLLGKWTRLAKFYGSLEKTYTGVVRLGFATDTYDAEGVAAGPVQRVDVTQEQLQKLADGFLGESEQMPPAYSAKKIGGKPAYAIARAGEVPVLRAARIVVTEFVLGPLVRGADGAASGDGAAGPAGTVDVPFLLQISSGGYVRSVAHAMGEMLGCGAHLAALRRVAAGPLRLEQSWTLEQLEAMAGHGDQRADGIAARLPHPRTMLPELPNVTADAGTLARLRHGMLVALPEFSHAPVVKVFEGQDGLAAVARRVAGVLFQPEIVLLS